MCAYGAPKNVYTLNKKQKRCAYVKHLEVCGRRLRLSGNTCDTFQYIKMPFIVLLEAPPCFHPIGMACVSGDGSVCH